MIIEINNSWSFSAVWGPDCSGVGFPVSLSQLLTNTHTAPAEPASLQTLGEQSSSWGSAHRTLFPIVWESSKGSQASSVEEKLLSLPFFLYQTSSFHKGGGLHVQIQQRTLGRKKMATDQGCHHIEMVGKKIHKEAKDLKTEKLITVQSQHTRGNHKNQNPQIYRIWQTENIWASKHREDEIREGQNNQWWDEMNKGVKLN